MPKGVYQRKRGSDRTQAQINQQLESLQKARKRINYETRGKLVAEAVVKSGPWKAACLRNIEIARSKSDQTGKFLNSPEARANKLISQQSPEYQQKWVEGMRRWMKKTNKPPNGLEQFFMDNCGFTVLYTGNRSVWVQLSKRKFKNPDFIVPGTNIVIELFGDYWHRGENPQKLVDKYRLAGYECFVFWESEIYDLLGNTITIP